MTTLTLEERIQGSSRIRILREFVTNSAIFPLFDALRVITVEGLGTYLAEPPHYLMLLAAAVQAWFLGTRYPGRWWIRAGGNLIAPALYTALDFVLEGPAFFREPYHWVFWGFSLGMALLYLVEDTVEHLQTPAIILLNLWRAALFPALYALTELSGELEVFTWANIREYWLAHSGHAFILLAALLFGVLLGINETQINRYTHFLRIAARRLKEFSEWSLDPSLVENALNDGAVLRQRRVERTVLFMDIRGFTHWSENKTPEMVVGMLNRFYERAEAVILSGRGRKPHFIADEVVTWFEDPLQAVETARRLRREIDILLEEYGLSVGIGLHVGEVVEGLMGSSGTRSFNVIGDVVNTASRLQSAAGPGEVLISEALADRLAIRQRLGAPRLVQAKGKQQPVQVYPVPTISV